MSFMRGRLIDLLSLVPLFVFVGMWFYYPFFRHDSAGLQSFIDIFFAIPMIAIGTLGILEIGRKTKDPITAFIKYIAMDFLLVLFIFIYFLFSGTNAG